MTRYDGKPKGKRNVNKQAALATTNRRICGCGHSAAWHDQNPMLGPVGFCKYPGCHCKKLNTAKN